MSPLPKPPELPGQLAGFPSYNLSPTRPLARIHLGGLGPWWFSHDLSGRFDLVPPRGTCYLTEHPLGAFIEVFREISALDADDIAVRQISTLYVPRAMTLADCTRPRTRAFGVTGAIHSTEHYQLTQAWAATFAGAGFDGIRYLLSHDPSQRQVADRWSGGEPAVDHQLRARDVHGYLRRLANHGPPSPGSRIR